MHGCGTSVRGGCAWVMTAAACVSLTSNNPDTQASHSHIGSATIIANQVLALDSNNAEEDTPETTDKEVD